MTCEILRHFVNTFTADDFYSLNTSETLLQPIYCKCKHLKNKTLFLKYLLHFWNLHDFWPLWGKRWPSDLIYFRNYGVWKMCLDKCLEIPILEHPSIVNMLKGPKHMGNLHDRTFIFWAKITWKMSLLVICEILGKFVNTLTTDD